MLSKRNITKLGVAGSIASLAGLVFIFWPPNQSQVTPSTTTAIGSSSIAIGNVSGGVVLIKASPASASK